MDDPKNSNQATPCRSPIPLSELVEQAVDRYFTQLQGHNISNFYTLVMHEVERPLIATVLKHSGYNQSKASKILGVSRSTLRKKIELHQLF
ncbi:MAG: Fis family transcriptional regulator [Methylococcales bacterium]|nr:Fis family transcriptional regulator [Methylococcales bacterium]MCK5924685.1 Fis family transcriptional regulator [Methylococcales bacterium]